MCQSQADGGKRCAVYARPVYSAAMTQIEGSQDHERVALIEANHEALDCHRTHWEELRTNPVTVLNGRTLTDGHHRILVAAELGEPDLPVRHIS